MKQYLLSVHMVEGEPMPSPEEIQQSFADVDAFNAEVQAAGRWVFAGGLHPADVATVVRAQGDEVLTSDGPFAEAKEHLGGFWVVKAEDLDDALRWAAKGSAACRAPVEVRPFQDDAED
jgi:hypothetical protein